MTKSTMIELIEELQKLPQTEEIKLMIEEAKAGEYHDYKNKKYMCGKMESAGRLRKFGHPKLAERIENGEFDEIADEDDKKNLKAMALAGGFSEEQTKKLFGF